MQRAAVFLEPPKMTRGAVCDDHLQAGVAAFIQRPFSAFSQFNAPAQICQPARKIGQATSLVEKSATNVPKNGHASLLRTR